MAQPTPYAPLYSFTDFQTSNPSTPLPADKLDIELANIAITLGETLTNLAQIQADTGGLKNGTVGVLTLSAEALALISAAGANPRGQWLTATSYAAKDVVYQAGGTYFCTTAHTSGTFSTDLTAVKWVLLALASGSVALSSLSDVTVTSPVSGHLLKYNGSAWVNGLLVDANITAGTITFASMASSFSVTSTSLSGASNSNVPTTTAIKTYVDNQISRGTASPIASATTTSLTGNTFDYAHVTGTNTITAITLATDEECWVVFDGACTLTHNATSLILPGAANITTAANDRALFRGIDGTNVVCLTYVKANGQALIASSSGVVTVKKQVFTSSGTYTPSTGMLYCIVEAVDGGAGGGGAKCASSANCAVAKGGFGGAYGRSVFTAAQIGASKTVTIGAGGAGGNSTGTDGAAGGATSLGTLLVGVAATAGTGSTNATTTHANGSTQADTLYTTADFSLPGGTPGYGFAHVASGIGMNACGGSSRWGQGGPCGSVVGTGVKSGTNGGKYGGGGGGAVTVGTTSGTGGGDGAAGAMWITEFCSQ